MDERNGAVINQEKEYKIAIGARRFRSLLPLCTSTIVQDNYYFDYADYSIIRGGKFAIRIRYGNGVYELCVKELVSSNGTLDVRTENNLILDYNDALSYIKGGIAADMLNEIVGKEFVHDSVSCIGKVTTIRGLLPLSEQDVVELDKSDYLGISDYEIEFECKNEQSDELFGQWLKQLKIKKKPSKPKVVRFLDELTKNHD